MFGTSKTASLSSGLLARKGQARPAMRPQGFHGNGVSLEDLGWNDMGEEAPVPAPVALLDIAPAAEPIPAVLVEREALAAEMAAVPDAPRAISDATVARIGREVRGGKVKTAFTLRLDPERHLRLRLASASRNRSAQALVTAALDAFIATLPEVEGLVAQLAPATATSGGKK